MALVLAADVGGTKSNLALYSVEASRRLSLIREASFPSRQYQGLEAVVSDFLGSPGEHVSAAVFGIAGPVLSGTVMTPNLPWRVEVEKIAAVVGCERVRLMNDLASTAYGVLFLPPSGLQTLNPGKEREGNRAVIAAGTGLGQAFLFWDGKRYRPTATEGGHADFAPRNEQEIELLRFLEKTYSRVSYERVVSGPGLLNIFRFLDDGLGRPVHASVREQMKTTDPAAVVGEAGVAGVCRTCAEAVDIFVSLYGAQAGNLALAVMATGGVYVGGGIVTKLLPKITSGAFLESFRAKGRYTQLLSEIPVRIILNEKTSLIGAAHVAAELAD